MTPPIADNGHDPCAASRRSNGAPCTLPAGWGTDHLGIGRCKLHGGCTPSHVNAARKAVAEEAALHFGLSIEVDPQQALLDEVHRCAGAIAYYEAQVVAIEEDEGGVTVPTMFGPTPTVYVALLGKERERLVKVAAECIRLGLDARRVELAEQQGRLIAGVLRGVLADLGVADHPEAPAVVRRHLALAASA
jgi:hypothetical protein